MKVKIKCIYKDKVEPTLLKEIDTNEENEVDSFSSEVEKLISSILDTSSEVEGVFISRE